MTRPAPPTDDDKVLHYPVELFHDGYGSVFAIIVDLPKVLTFGGSEDEALAKAGQLLRAALDELAVAGQPLPLPSEKPGARTVGIRLSEVSRRGLR